MHTHRYKHQPNDCTPTLFKGAVCSNWDPDMSTDIKESWSKNVLICCLFFTYILITKSVAHPVYIQVASYHRASAMNVLNYKRLTQITSCNLMNHTLACLHMDADVFAGCSNLYSERIQCFTVFWLWLHLPTNIHSDPFFFFFRNKGPLTGTVKN